MTQKAALLAMRMADKKIEAVEMILKERSKLEDSLPQFDFVEEIHPSNANFLLVKVDAPRQNLRFFDYQRNHCPRPFESDFMR